MSRMMEQSVIFEKLTTIFKKVFNDDSIVLSKDITASDIGNWDSLTHMVMIGEVESEFLIKFKLRELNKMENVGGLIELIKVKLEN